MGSKRPRSLTLDAGALIAFERNDGRVRCLLQEANTHGIAVHIPAGVIAQVWRGGARQARVARLVRSMDVSVNALDLEEAMAVGVVAGRSGVPDIVDGSVVLVARRTGSIVVTSDPDDLAQIDPSLTLVRC